MIRSMTAYTRQLSQASWGDLTWEIRCVNHRYLDASFYLPDTLRDQEAVLREVLTKKIKRGKVDCSLKFNQNTAQQSAFAIDHNLLEHLKSGLSDIEQAIPCSSNSSLDILNWPGVIQEPELDVAAIKSAAKELYERAIDEIYQQRLREGSALADLINHRLEAIASTVQQVRTLLPDILQQQSEKLFNKVSELVAEVDKDRLEQELVMLANKADVSEEMDRLDTHIKEVKRVLKSSEPVGRRLDFLMQELNRESNTLSSKSQSALTTQHAIDLKVWIEQMREQIQNIE